ncbi:MAG: aldehyde dehydrogenase family protein, partial [candidate division NC10 bacterium]|nr:aldehyde dehydrogenase family protein [candidate division NC10 bacterium]
MARLREGARVFARLTIRERIRLLVAMREGYTRVAAEVVEHSCRAKRIVLGTPLEGEEWALGPWSVLRHFRLLLDTLAALDRKERPPGAKLQRTSDGRLALQVLPGSALDAVLFKGIRAEVHMRGGVGEAELYAGTKLYRQLPHPPGLVLILGGGNSASIPCHDVLTKLFNEGKVCLLKMHPINAYLGPLLEEAFAPAIERGFLRIAYGGAEEGGYLASHPGIDEIHLTGSHATHEAILWGEDLARRAERKANRSPLHLKRITSQLGCVSPVLVVPGPYLESQLAFQAQELAGAMVHNAGCNCHTPRLLVLPRGWAQRDTFLRHFEAALAQAPLRMAYYPGSVERWEQLVEGRERVRTIGAPVGGMLPWTVVTGLRPDDRREPLFSTEAFGPVLGEVEIGSTDPME